MDHKHRIQSSSGRWASCVSAVEQRHWISEDMVDLWKSALDKAQGKEADVLRDALDRVETLGYGSSKVEVVLPMGPKEKALAEKDLAQRKKEYMDGDRGGWGFSRRPSESDWLGQLAWHKKDIDYKAAKKRLVRFVMAPSVKWVSNPGDASLFDAHEARGAIEKALAAVRLRGLLPKARAASKKQGARETSAMEPKFDTHGLGTKELATAKSSPFVASEEFEDKVAIAIYVDRGGSDKGFADNRGRVKNDIAEACLFPSKNKALAFARRCVGDCHAVDVVISAVGCAPLLGSPRHPDDISAVIAARERREIEKVLERAKLEELEAELVRRRSEARAGGEKPVDMPERTKRSSRL